MRDSDVRAVVRKNLREKHGNDPDTRIVEEMGVWSGAVRVDIAVINGKLLGYELKSNSDTLDRLPRQIEIYGKIFDRMTLVVGDRLAPKALKLIPGWWGCVVASMDGAHVALHSEREPRRNPGLDLTILVQMLWKDEAIAILEKYGLADGWRSRRAADVGNRLLSELSFKHLAEEIRSALKVREKLGQLSTGEFDMAVDAIAHPTCGTTGL
jgi:hypothetical protein